MSAALLRRSPACVSDLKMDRWLLGETPGSDEARALEAHLAACADCASRIRALRSVYQHVPRTRPRTPAPRVERPPAEVPEPDGVLQMVILRDGLLVGSELFTPGSYAVGSDRRAGLRLDDGVAPLHARLYFRGGRVTVEDAGGGLFVNGFTTKSCEVRPIDEVQCGPYQLRARVIHERWSDALPLEARRTQRTQVARPLPRPTLVAPPPAAPAEPPRAHARPLAAAELPTELVHVPELPALELRLTLSLSWGLSRQQTASFAGEVVASEAGFPLWGFTAPEGFVLADRGPRAFRLFVPPRATVTRRRGGRTEVVLDGELGRDGERRFVELSSGEAVTLTEGLMSLEASAAPALSSAPRYDWRTAPWLLMALTAALLVGVMGLSFVELPERDSLEERPLPKLSVYLKPPVKPEPPKRPRKDDASTPKRPTAQRPKAPRAGAVAGLFSGLPAGTSPGAALGISGDGGALARARVGIGGAGALGHEGFGTGGVGGQVSARPGAGGFRGGPRSSIDKNAVAMVINAHLGEISSCYERALTQRSSLGGSLAAEWSITTAGDVSQARVKGGTLNDAGVANCVLGVIKRLRFPKARGGSVVVTYPFLFQASSF